MTAASAEAGAVDTSSKAAARPAWNIGFVVEQALGHITHTKNLQSYIPHDPEVIAHWALIDFKTEGLAARIPVYSGNWTVRAGIRANRKLAAMARRSKLDALFFHTQVPAILAQPWMHRIPSIVSLDATPIQYDQFGEFYQHQAGPAWLERIKWKLNCSCFAAARHLVVWAEWTKRGLVSDYRVPADKITVIPPGVIVRDWVRPTPRQHKGGVVKILFVGGDLKRKGGHLLLQAFRNLNRAGVELHLVTKDRIEKQPGIFVYNDIEPNSSVLKGLYHDCDIFVLPTMGDCLPMVLSEAGAAGLAVVSTDIAGIPEIVQDGITGLTVPPGDVSKLAGALQSLLDNPGLRLELGSRACRHVSQAYDAEANTARLLQLLKAHAAK